MNCWNLISQFVLWNVGLSPLVNEIRFPWPFFHELWWRHLKSLHKIGEWKEFSSLKIQELIFFNLNNLDFWLVLKRIKSTVRSNSVKETCITFIQNDQQCWYIHIHVYYSIYVALDICKDFITEFTAKSKTSCIDRLLLLICAINWSQVKYFYKSIWTVLVILVRLKIVIMAPCDNFVCNIKLL